MVGAGTGGGFLVIAVGDGGRARGLSRQKIGPGSKAAASGEAHLSLAANEEGFFGARGIKIFFAVELFELGLGIKEFVEFADDVFVALRALIDAGVASKVIKASPDVAVANVFDRCGNEDVVKGKRTAQSAVNEEKLGIHLFILA